MDLGYASDKVLEHVSIGDMVTLDRTFESCGDRFISKSLDNRVGVFVMLETLKRLNNHKVDVYAVATVQEEVGLRGASTAAYAVEPDVGIALDTTLANDYPGISDLDSVTQVGKGVGIKVMDSSLICHPKLVAHCKDLAKQFNIAHQMEVLPKGGTDAGAVQRIKAGSASITLSIPTRYIHTVNEMVDEKDIESAVALLSAYLEDAHTRDYSYH